MKSKNKIVYSSCDTCGYEGVGVMQCSLFGDPILFECILCNPNLLERENERKISPGDGCYSQTEIPATIRI